MINNVTLCRVRFMGYTPTTAVRVPRLLNHAVPKLNITGNTSWSLETQYGLSFLESTKKGKKKRQFTLSISNQGLEVKPPFIIYTEVVRFSAAKNTFFENLYIIMLSDYHIGTSDYRHVRLSAAVLVRIYVYGTGITI